MSSPTRSDSRRLALALTLTLAGTLGGACAGDEREKPRAPDLQPLVDAYAGPTRDFDAQAAAEVEELVERKVGALVDMTGVADLIEDALGSLGEEPAGLTAGLTAGLRRGVVLEGEGFARVTRICSGHGTPAPPVDRDANGVLELTAGYTEDGLDPVIFGGAAACKEQVGQRQLVVEGGIALHIGDNLKLSDLPASPVLFQLAGFALSVDGTERVAGGFDFQVCRGDAASCVPGNFELLLGLPGERTLVFFIDLADKSGGFRAANGRWDCDFLAGTCQSGGATVTIPVYQL
ncbi:MAG TPA: hypothetical protein VNO30_05905 [Kofleriaceae bacterium]|nr:hypothetical protein [Kofleriaceae bacterium]